MKNPQTPKIDDANGERARQQLVECVLELQREIELLKKRVAALEAAP